MNEFEGLATIVSHSGTRHLVADGTIGQQSHGGGRITTQCGRGLKTDLDTKPREPVPGDLTPGPFIAKQDCVWCLAQLRFAAGIRQLFSEAATKKPPSIYVSVAEAAKTLKTSAEQIRQAVGGAPDLYWEVSGTMIRRIDPNKANWPSLPRR